MSEKTDWLYYLYFVEDGQENIFYAGISNDPHTRFHKHCADQTNTKKAKFIRRLTELGIDIAYRKVRPCTNPDDEYWYINELENLGHILTNTASGNWNRLVKNKPKPTLSPITPEDLSGHWDKSITDKTWQCKSIGAVFILRKTQPRGLVFKVHINGGEPIQYVYDLGLKKKEVLTDLVEKVNNQI